MTPSHFVDSPFPGGEWRSSSPSFEGGVADGKGGYDRYKMNSSDPSELRTQRQ